MEVEETEEEASRQTVRGISLDEAWDQIPFYPRAAAHEGAVTRMDHGASRPPASSPLAASRPMAASLFPESWGLLAETFPCTQSRRANIAAALAAAPPFCMSAALSPQAPHGQKRLPEEGSITENPTKKLPGCATPEASRPASSAQVWIPTQLSPGGFAPKGPPFKGPPAWAPQPRGRLPGGVTLPIKAVPVGVVVTGGFAHPPQSTPHRAPTRPGRRPQGPSPPLLPPGWRPPPPTEPPPP